MITAKSDFKNYRKMCEPFQTPDEAQGALKNFFDSVETLRNVTHMMDVHIIVKMNILRDGEETHAIVNAHFGNPLEGPNMCMWSIGENMDDFEPRIRDIVRRINKFEHSVEEAEKEEDKQ